jgi:predicted DNA-binding protein (UPF0251 family)
VGRTAKTFYLAEANKSMRPKKCKIIHCCPKSYKFIPSNCCSKEEVILTAEEIEALDLKNNRGLDQIQAAQMMGTSQSTFQRILTSAYTKTSDAIVNGKNITIEKN